MAVEGLFDGVLVLLILMLAAAAVHARQLYTAIVMFIAFGLVLALAWARLGAADLALAEAAIGAGLTGTLLLSAYAHTRPRKIPHRFTWRYFDSVMLSSLILILLLAAAWPLPEYASEVSGLAYAAVSESGVAHPVTAVLLNFRAWDTLLELLVLLLALLGAHQLRPRAPAPAASTRLLRPWPILVAWSQILAPLCVLFGGYLLWRGSAYPGGAFQAGALLAAGGVILRLNGMLPAVTWDRFWVRGMVLLGLAVFLAVGLWGWLSTGTWLTYPPASSSISILVIEAAATLSIATTLILLVVGDVEGNPP